MSPLLQHTSQWDLGRPARLVLVPVGRLSQVPWHAARSGPGRYACAAAVISYAASGRQLIDTSQRPPLPLQADPVVIGNPAGNLPCGTIEGAAVQGQCYPQGRYLGQELPGIGPRPAGPRPAGPGSPAEVLGALPAADRPGASVLHLGCHAILDASVPGQSYLELAGRERLTVETILRQAAGRPPGAPGGLVSLAACASDGTGSIYDEALTLATAFLAAGATTVVGARWNVVNDVTALLMFMFHHYLSADGQSPRDALRLAQLWMLDPDRKAPAGMPDMLARLLIDPGTRRAIPEIASWAAFTHQGH
jgi:hypothetical protein